MDAKLQDDKYYTAEEASVYIKVKTQTVNNYFRQGKLRGKKIGPKDKWHVKGSDLRKKMKEFGYL